MESVTNKALIIAVGIFITIAITSGILFTINEMKNVYQHVYETDTNITSRFDEFDAYDNTEKTGIEVANAINKYDENSNVTISLQNTIITESQFLKTEARIADGTYSAVFTSKITRNASNNKVTITFTKK